MKLLYITNGISGAGGLERVLSVKASYFAEKLNYEVHILTLNEKNNSQFFPFSSKIKIHDISLKKIFLSYIYSYTTKIKKLVNEIKPDIILVCDDGLKGFFLPIFLGKPCPMIYERHVSKIIELRENSNWLLRIAIQFKWKMMNILAANFDRFVVLTEGNKKEWPLKNLIVIPNPLSFYPKTSANLISKKVIAVGKQSYQKGYDLLLEAWKLVVSIYPDWNLEIYGTFDSSQQLEMLSKQLQLESTVHFHLPVQDIEKHYLESSIFVLSSRFEGFAMVLIEAMSCGVPCISFDCPYGPGDIITDGTDGLLVENGDIQDLANSIIKLIKTPLLRKKMGENSRNSVIKYYPDTICNQWDILFNSLLIK